MINKIIRNFVAKMVAGRTDDGIMITLRDPQKVEFQTAMMQDLLMRRGIDPNAIQSEAQLKMIINQIKAMEKAEDAAQSGIRNTESAKVFNIEGQQLDPNKPIIGGTQTDKKLSKELSDRLSGKNTELIKQRIADKKIDDDLPPPGSRGGDDDIAAPVQSAEESLRDMTEAEIKANIEAQNKKGIENILKRKNREDVYGLEDYDTTNMSEIKKEIIRTETKLGNLNPDSPDFREKAKALSDRIIALKNKMREDKAGGGRIGFVKGTGFRFLQRVFGKQGLEEMKTRDPEMYVGLLEVVDMYRKRDKEGLKMYLQKFLPHMDDAQIEDFIRGSDGSEGLVGELIRLGSGRDYKGKLEMIKKSEEMKKLRDLEVTEDMLRKPNADGGRIGYKLGTGIEAAIAENKKLEEDIATQKRIAKFLENRAIRNSPFGILMDQELPRIEGPDDMPPTTLNKSGKDVKIQKLPYKVEQENTVLFSDGTVYYKDTGEFYDEDLGKVTSPSPGAKPVRRTEEAKDGGIMRLGLKEGSGMTRRTFLKILGGAMSIPIIGKIFKPLKIGKTVTKVPIIKTDAVPGKPEWFDQLVNKVIIEGDEVTKRFATKDREIVHMKKLDEDTNVMVYQDLDEGAVRVEYESLDNMYEDPVSLRYKKPKPDEGDPRPSAEFDVAESGPVGRADGPDDYSIDIDEVGGTSISDLTSDVSKLKEYATGQKPTLKEIVQTKKRKDKAKRITEGGEAEMDAVIERQGEFIENDLVDLDSPELASGGIARMLGE